MQSFEDVLTEWTNAKFSEWKSAQDEKLQAIEAEEAIILANRRNLAKETKQLAEGEQHEKLKELLKLYQVEIDSLGVKVKSSYGLFREAFATLRTLPDPLPIFQLCLEQASSLTDINILREENAELCRALAESTSITQKYSNLVNLSGQKDKTISKLEEELQTKESSLQQLHTVLSEQEKQHMILTNRNEELVIEMGRLKKAYDDLVKEKNSLSQTKLEQDSLKLAELDVVNMNSETSRRQIMELQRENELLRAEVESIQSTLPILDTRRIKELEEDIMDIQAKLEEEQCKNQTIIKKKDEEIALHLSKLESLCEMEKFLQELRALKAAEFPETYDPLKDQSLELLLQQKNKKLEGDLVQMRNNVRELQNQLKQMTIELENTHQKSMEMEKVITRYEESAAIATMPGETDSISSTIGNDYGKVLNEPIITVLTNQRDRLKRQNQELEDKVTAVSQQLEGQKSESNRLQTDNIKLFERIKFLEAFNNKKPFAKDNVDTELGELLHQYQPAYEDRLDPFRLFFQNEVFKRFKSLGQTDRTVWKLGRIFLTNKFIRRFMVTYFILLHLIMLYVLFRGQAHPHIPNV